MPALNQYINFGKLNRLRGSMRFQNFSNLNITAAFLTAAGIRFTQTGEGVEQLKVMVATVPSEEAVVMVEVVVNLVKTLAIVGAFQAQQQAGSVLGPAVVRPDTASGLQPYSLFNVAIQNPREQDFSGKDAGYPLRFSGYMPINADMFTS